MKKTLLLIIGLLTLLNFTNAQNNKVEGSWLLNKVIVEGKTHKPFFIMDFNNKGIVNIKDINVATWKHKGEVLILESETNEYYKGDFKIIKLTSGEMILESNTQAWHLSKYNFDKIEAENTKSGFIGTWKLKNNGKPNAIKLLTFNAPDKYILVEKEDGLETRNNGSWIFNKSTKSLLMMGRIDNIRGENHLLKINDKAFVLENSEGKFSADRVIQTANNIERLSFTQADFLDDNENYKYGDDEEKLPWKSSYQMMMSLNDTDQLIYNYSNLIEDTKTFENKTLKAEVKTNEDEQMLSIDFIFQGYDRYNLPDDTAMPDNQFDFRFDNRIYPLKDLFIRITGKETITTKAGTFNCTLLEGFSNMSEESYKLWMINDKPGVYAKIIADKSGMFGHYHIYELTNIK